MKSGHTRHHTTDRVKIGKEKIQVPERRQNVVFVSSDWSNEMASFESDKPEILKKMADEFDEDRIVWKRKWKESVCVCAFVCQIKQTGQTVRMFRLRDEQSNGDFRLQLQLNKRRLSNKQTHTHTHRERERALISSLDFNEILDVKKLEPKGLGNCEIKSNQKRFFNQNNRICIF